jgi:hypothetical protein
LRDVHLRGCPVEAAHRGDLDEVFELTEVHGPHAVTATADERLRGRAAEPSA